MLPLGEKTTQHVEAASGLWTRRRRISDELKFEDAPHCRSLTLKYMCGAVATFVQLAVEVKQQHAGSVGCRRVL